MSLPYGIDQIEKQKLMGGNEHEVLYKHLDDGSTPTPVKDMAKVADDFYIKPSADEIYIINTIRVVINDNTTTFDSTGFGGGSALTNGSKFEIRRQEATSDAVVVRDFTDGELIKKNADFAKIGKVTAMIGTANSMLMVEIDLDKNGSPIRLDGDRGESLHYQTQDTHAGLLEMYVTVTGLMCQGKNV